jgi:hypothetical protein
MAILQKIISGGQSGADRAALDVAIEMGLQHGGWVPRGRRTETGALPDRYMLRETDSRDYAQRTAKNVQDADATIIFSHGPPVGGTALTREIAVELGRPWLHLDLDQTPRFESARRIDDWLRERSVSVLNVAGPRASQDPRIYTAVRDVLTTALMLVEMHTPPEAVLQDPVPVSIDEAIGRLVQKLPLKDRTMMANMSAEEVDRLSRLNAFISRQLGLERDNARLMAACCRRAGATALTPDQAAGVIRTALWESLQKTHRLRRVK